MKETSIITPMEWYYIEINDQGKSTRKGPWSSMQMSLFAQRSEIQPNSLVWHSDLEEWKSWESQEHLAQAEVTKVQELPVVANAIALAPTKPFAGFWIRALALFIDGFILQMLYLLLYAFLPLTGTTETEIAKGESIPWLIALFSIQLVISASYNIWFVKNYAGTLGKILLGLSIVRIDDAPMNWSTATSRFFATWLSSLTLGVGYLMAAFDPEKCSLHDRVAKTRVIRK